MSECGVYLCVHGWGGGGDVRACIGGCLCLRVRQ